VCQTQRVELDHDHVHVQGCMVTDTGGINDKSFNQSS
jgi:hypothetical protein